METKDALKLAYDAVSDKKAEDIIMLDTSGLTPEFDYFLIATGKNPNHSKTLSDNVEEKLAEKGVNLTRPKEGYGTAAWILLDFGSIIVHIFGREERELYNLEHIWGDAKPVEL